MSGATLPHEPAKPSALLRAGERLIAWRLTLMLLGSSFAHLGNPFFFLSTVYSYGLTGIRGGEAVALVLPYAQLVTVACLLTRRWMAEAYLLGVLMFAAFVAVQAAALGRGNPIPCGCFGPSEDSRIGVVSLVVAASGVALALAGWRCTTLLNRLRLVAQCLSDKGWFP